MNVTTARPPRQRLRSLACLWRGHRWQVAGTRVGVVLMACARCSLALTVPFGDLELVHGAPRPDRARGALGQVTATRGAVALVTAATFSDPLALAMFRADLISRPEPAIDALTALATTLAWLLDDHGGDSGRTLRALGLQNEFAAASRKL